MSDGCTGVIYLVSEVRQDHSKALRAFESEAAAEEFRDDYTSDYEELDDRDWGDYHVGMGGKATYPIEEVPVRYEVEPGTKQERDLDE